MVRAVIFAAAMLVAASSDAAAQGRVVFGVGASNSCGVWIQARQDKSTNATVLQQWVAGYLSGRNMEFLDPDALVGTDHDALMAWIDNYCRANPLDRVGTASFKLFDELRSRSQRR
jgi:hypothetical protein